MRIFLSFAGGSVFQLVGETDAAAGIIVKARSCRRCAATGAERGFELEALGQIDLNLTFGAAGCTLLGADVNAAGDISAGFNRCTGGVPGSRADRKPVEAEAFANRCDRIATDAGERCKRLGDLRDLQRTEL